MPRTIQVHILLSILSPLSYLVLEGDIACALNGEGPEMSTTDIVKLYRKETASFFVGVCVTTQSRSR